MKVEYINPFVVAINSVFQTMLGCDLQRGKIMLKQSSCPEYFISGVIGLSGRAVGTVVLSLDREVALSAAGALLSEPQSEINADVKDAVGELVNMVAGAAKAELAELNMALTIPTVITGRFSIEFGSKEPPIVIPFSSPWGNLAVDVSLEEVPQPVGC